jgi:TPR repeat protein
MRKILGTLLVGMMLSVGGSIMRAGPLEDATGASQRGDYATALRLLRPLAEQGNAVAQYNLGVMYTAGQGVAQDDRVAVKWFRLGAEQGNPDAQANLGFMYDSGQVLRRITTKQRGGIGSLLKRETP